MSEVKNETSIPKETDENVTVQEETVQTSEIAIIGEDAIRNKIYEIRGQQVMLDFELADIYGYSTKRFNEQVKRNVEKFDGDDFMFQLTEQEWAMMRSHFATASRRNERYTPYAFTEQGVYMLMTVLKGELATRQSKALVRLFKRMKDHIVDTQELAAQRDLLRLSTLTVKNAYAIQDVKTLLNEQRVLFSKQQQLLMDHDEKLSIAFEQISETVKKSEISPVLLQFQSEEQTEFLLLDHQPISAHIAYISIYKKARKSLYIVDDYIDLSTLRLLHEIQQGVEVSIFSDNKGNHLHASDYENFKIEFPAIPITFITTAEMMHDRYIVLDYGEPDERYYHCGSSSKDAGRKNISTITELKSEDTAMLYRPIVERLKKNPPLILK